MSVLAVLLPARERLHARAVAGDTAGGMRLPAEWAYAYSADGHSAAQTGSAAAALLPRADHIVLVLADTDVSWHRVDIPRAAPARMRAALLGVMEEDLLEDDEALHFALAPGAVPGQPGWVAVTHRPRLAAALAELEQGGRSVERVGVALAPAEQPRGHFHEEGDGGAAAPWLALAHAGGACSLRLSGTLARAVLPAEASGARWTATPAAAAAAEHWLGAPVTLMSDAERALEAAQSALNLRQFDLAARHRGTRALREWGKRFMSREWRAVRVGLAALVAVQLIGLNAYAWQQRHAIEARHAAMSALLKSAYPGVRTVLDAPVQMQRETERLRAAAGQPGAGDLEALFGAAAAAWPDGLGPAQSLRFESGRLTLSAAGWAEPQVTQFKQRLRGLGYAAEMVEGRLVVTRSRAASGTGST